MTIKKAKKTAIKFIKETKAKKNEQHMMGTVGNKFWILAKEPTSKLSNTLDITEFDKPLPIEWHSDRNSFIKELLSDFNLLKNGTFGDAKEKSISGWEVKAKEPASVKVDLSEKWHLKDGHTAFLSAPTGVERPYFIAEHKIPAISDGSADYLFSGYFATHRAGGYIHIDFYDEADNKLGDKIVTIPFDPRYGGGQFLESYTLIEFVFTPVEKSQYMRLKIALGEQEDFSEPNAYLFFTEFFLGEHKSKNHPFIPYSDSVDTLVTHLFENKWLVFGHVKFPKETNRLSDQINSIFDAKYVASILKCSEDDAYIKFIKKLKQSPYISCNRLFSSVFYQKQLDYLGISTSIPLITHYLKEGWKIGIDPHPLFDTDYYRNTLGIGGFDMPPLIHYINNSNKFKADPSPFFDEKYYNHNLSINKLENSQNSLLEDFIMREEWVSFHPDITQQSIGPCIRDVELIDIIERDKGITHGDFINLIDELRSFSFIKKSKLPHKKIQLSTIILNYNKLVHTIFSAYCAHLALKNISHELIVVDNGSDFFCYKNIARYLNNIPHCHVIRIERNRFFGEGNNIALDQAKGQYVAFLNNDAYVNTSTFDKLIKAFDNSKMVGATAPVFMQSNYTLQEFGGRVSGCGQVIQVGKNTKLDIALLDRLKTLPKTVDYCSAACCVISKKVLDKVGGFDYIFEPFYYEDTDLFSRIRCAGYELHIEYDAHVMHFENTSTRDYLKNDFHSLIDTNKRKFSNRWFGKLEQLTNLGQEIPRLKLFSEQPITLATKQRAFVYTPFPLNPGGGEKYILTLAVALSEKYHTTIIFPEIYSTNRLKMVAEDLDLSVVNLAMMTWHEALKANRPDVFVVMGNEIIPSVPAIGRKNFYHCQFPFPLDFMPRPDDLETLNDYEGYIVNSEFTRCEIYKQIQLYGLPQLPVHIVYPPCWSGNIDGYLEKIRKRKLSTGAKQLSIVNVGRFFRHGHNKRQDIVLDIINILKNNSKLEEWEIKGTLLGGVSKSEEDYYKILVLHSQKIDVTIASNVERSVIEQAYHSADIYIHAAGFGKQEGYSPHELEHFGISIVEAMIHGVYPLVYGIGGPLEIVNKLGLGDFYTDMDDAVDKILKIIHMPIEERYIMQEKMLKGCVDFSVLVFKERIHSIFKVD